MTFAVRDWLEQQGVDRKKIHFELFHTQTGEPVTGGKRNVVEAGLAKAARAVLRLAG